MSGPAKVVLILGGLALAIALPWLLPAYKTQLAMLWLMVLFALTWDVMGGQMGYNSFGNILFFGVGMYACAVVQRDWGLDYFPGLVAGHLVAVVLAAASAAILGAGVILAVAFVVGAVVAGIVGAALDAGPLVGLAGGALAALAVAVLAPAWRGAGILGLRGHYFAIGSLGLGIAAGEIASGIEFIGAGSGMVTPVFPGDIDSRNLFFYFVFLSFAAITFVALGRLYAGRFGLAVNAIRDDEDKAEAMGLHTAGYKTVAWCVSAVFLGLAGAAAGNLLGFIDPRDVAFAGPTFGVWMVLMAILGGKGTVWGPVLGAAVFHVTQELFWTYFLGWQRIALGLLIVVIVVFFPQGILGWARTRWPERFGEIVEEASPAGGGAGRGGPA